MIFDFLHGRDKYYRSVNMSRKLTTEEFINRAVQVHGNRFSYDDTIYEKMTKKVNITCKVHGNFLQNPADHLWNHGCPSCKSDSASCDVNDIKQLFEQTHKKKYSYDFSTYKRNSIKMKMICSEHGEFWQKPELHKNGAGCRKCTASGGPGKYCESLFVKSPDLKNKEGTLYFVELKDTDGTIYFKIGITTCLKTRFYNFIKNNEGTILWTRKDTLYNCFLLEQKFLEAGKDYKYLPISLTVGGKTECFSRKFDYDDF